MGNFTNAEKKGIITFLGLLAKFFSYSQLCSFHCCKDTLLTHGHLVSDPKSFLQSCSQALPVLSHRAILSLLNDCICLCGALWNSASPFLWLTGSQWVAGCPFSILKALPNLVSDLTLLMVHSIPTAGLLMLKSTRPRVYCWGRLLKTSCQLDFKVLSPTLSEGYPFLPMWLQESCESHVKGLVKAKINNIHCSTLMPTDGLFIKEGNWVEAMVPSACLLWKSWVVKNLSRSAPILRVAQTTAPIVPREYPNQQAINRPLMQWLSSYPV